MKNIFIILILAFFSALLYYLTRNWSKKIIIVPFIFFSGWLFGKVVELSFSQEILLLHTFFDLLYAMLFLYGLDFERKKFFQGEIGCSCKIGAKRYWSVIAMALGASLIVQIVGDMLFQSDSLSAVLGSALIALLLGYGASFTKLKSINATHEVATTMLFLLSAVAGMQIA